LVKTTQIIMLNILVLYINLRSLKQGKSTHIVLFVVENTVEDQYKYKLTTVMSKFNFSHNTPLPISQNTPLTIEQDIWIYHNQ